MTNAGRSVLRVVVPRRREAARRYVIELVLGEWLGQSFEIVPGDAREVIISRPGLEDDRQVIVPDTLLGSADETWLTPGSLPRAPLPKLTLGPMFGAARQDGIPALFSDGSADGQAARTDDGAVRLLIDIFGSVFYLVTRYEELVDGERDQHERYMASSSAMGSPDMLGRPLADEYLDVLWSALRAQWPDLTRPPSTFRLRPTHDVDQPWAVLDKHPGAVVRSAGKDVLIRHDPGLAWRRLRSLARRGSGWTSRDPFDTFDLLMTAAEEHGLGCTFYLLAGNGPGDPDFRYRIDDPRIGQLMRRIASRGHEIGLHASYASHGSTARLQAEFDALRLACDDLGISQSQWGIRHHYLRFDARRSWRDYAAVGFSHDSTLGYAEAVGFRCGTGREFPVFAVLEDRPLPLRERPLVVMDVTLHEYLGLDRDAARARIEQVVAECRVHGTDAVILYHNNSLPLFRIGSEYPALLGTLSQR